MWPLLALGRWSSYTVTIVLEFACAESVWVTLDEWSSSRGGCLNRSDCNIKIKNLCCTTFHGN